MNDFKESKDFNELKDTRINVLALFEFFEILRENCFTFLHLILTLLLHFHVFPSPP